MVWLLFLQLLKEDINGALVFLIVLPCFAGVDQIQKGDEVAFFLRGPVPDVADQGGLIQAFRLDPKIFRRFFALSLCIHIRSIR